MKKFSVLLMAIGVTFMVMVMFTTPQVIRIGAQDGTPVVATEEAAPVATVNTQQVVAESTGLLYVVAAFLAGGGTVLSTVALLGGQILKSPVLISFLEHLSSSASPELLESIRTTVKLVDEITDNIPADKKSGVFPITDPLGNRRSDGDTDAVIANSVANSLLSSIPE